MMAPTRPLPRGNVRRSNSQKPLVQKTTRTIDSHQKRFGSLSISRAHALQLDRVLVAFLAVDAPAGDRQRRAECNIAGSRSPGRCPKEESLAVSGEASSRQDRGLRSLLSLLSIEDEQHHADGDQADEALAAQALDEAHDVAG